VRLYTIFFVIALVVLGGFAVQRFVSSKIASEIKLQELENKLDTERKIESAVEKSIKSNPDSNPNVSLDILRERQLYK
jgi:hypothetical protein